MKVLIVGMGTLGCRVARLVQEEMVLCDYDIVEERNLYIQDLYTLEDVGTQKVVAAKKRLGDVTIIPTAFSEEAIVGVEAIIDCTDSLQSKLLINDIAKRHGIPLIIGTAAKSLGMAYAVTNGACWRCITEHKISVDNCDEGIDPETADAVAAMQYELLQKTLRQEKTSLLTLRDGTWHAVQVTPRNCAACRGERTIDTIQAHICKGTGRLQLRTGKHIDLASIKLPALQKYASALRLRVGEGTVLVHKHGLLEFENVTEESAREFWKTLSTS